MGEKPFIKFYPSDFLGGTSGLSPAERGTYITLLCLIYEADGPIARDDARLSRRCGSPKAAFVRALAALTDEGKIVERDGMLTNPRAEKAIVDRSNRTQNATHAANAKWAAHAEKTQQKQGADDAGAMRAQCVGDASQKPEPELENTHPIGCGASAPKKGFWDECIQVLKEGGVAEPQARSLLGKWTKGRGRDQVREAVTGAAGTADPVAYLEAAFRPQKDVMAEAMRILTEGRQ